jgi:hypothetical protein
VLLHDIQVVTIGMKGGDPQFSPLFAVVAMVVIGADDRDIFFAQYLSYAASECGLACGTITNNAEDNWAIGHGTSWLKMGFGTVMNADQ